MNALRDRKTGIVYKPLADCYCGLTNQLLVQVRDRNPGVNNLGFWILSGSRLSDFVNRYSDNHYSYDRIQSQWRKDKSAVIPNPLGYTALYAIQQTALDADTEMSVESGAKKADISRAFKKMLKSKSTNKKLLNSFVGYVAWQPPLLGLYLIKQAESYTIYEKTQTIVQRVSPIWKSS